MPLHLTIQGLDELRRNAGESAKLLDREAQSAMRSSVNTVKNEAQHLAPFKTGTLRRSIFTDIQDNGYKGVVGQDPHQASYGAGVEFGTAPHTIVPTNKKALFWKGALNPYRKVHHPGTKAKPFMSPALENNLEKIKEFFLEAMDKVLKSMAK